MKDQLWQGKWITQEELEHHFNGLVDNINAAMEEILSLQLVLQTCDKLSIDLINNGPSANRIKKYIIEMNLLNDEEVDPTMRELGEFLSRKNLEEKIMRELGDRDPFTLKRNYFKASNRFCLGRNRLGIFKTT